MRINLPTFVAELPDGLTTAEIVDRLQSACGLTEAARISPGHTHAWSEVHAELRRQGFANGPLRVPSGGKLPVPTHVRNHP